LKAQPVFGSINPQWRTSACEPEKGGVMLKCAVNLSNYRYSPYYLSEWFNN